jgi:hypothetical protein
MPVKVRVLGATQSAANIRAMSKAVRKKFYDTMLEISQKILERSHRYVPYKTGKLQESGKVKGYPGRYPVVYTSYGGPDVPYALIQHENLDYSHPGGRKAKYLELAVKDYEPEMKKAFEVAARNETQKFSMAGKVMTRVR